MRLKNKKIIPYFIIAIICTSLFAKPFGNGDEFWNYSFARNIADGMLPYRDFNIILTPLSVYLAGFFLYIFGSGLIVHRVLCYILAVAIFCTVYHLCVKISKSSFISLISVLFIFALHFPYFLYNYNYLSVLFLLLIFEMELENKTGTRGKHILVGLIVGLTALTKQSTGATIMLANLIVCLYLIRHSNHKKSIIISRILASGVPICIYVIYLLESRTFDAFWEYAVEGITTFSHRTTPIDLILSGPGNLVFFAMIIVGYYLIIRKMVKDGTNHILISMLVFNISWMMIAYPLCDTAHLLCVLIPLVPVLFFCVKIKPYKDIEKYVCIAVTTVVCTIAIIPFSAIGDNYMLSDLNNYQGVAIDASLNENIKIITNYIKQKNEEGYHVRIASEASCAYNIPLDKYEKNWDLLLVGNVGSNNIESLLKEERKTVYLVYKDSSALGKQNYFELIDYIKENYDKIGEVLNYDVYEASN